MAEEKLPSVIDWINTFSDLSRDCKSIKDLADGVLMLEAMMKIAPDCVDDADFNGSPGSDVSLRLTNLKAVIIAIEQFHSNVLGFDCDLSDSDLEAIANEDVPETVKLAGRILGCAVQCSDKSTFVARIMGMDQNSQAQLMVMIDEAINASQAGSYDDAYDDDRDAGSFSEGSDMDSPSKNSQMEDIESLRRERDMLSRRVSELEDTNASLQQQTGQIREKSMELLKEDRKKAERVKAKEVERLKMAKNALSRREIELQERVRELTYKFEDATNRLEMHRKQSESTVMKLQQDVEAQTDQLDILRAQAARLPKVEAQLNLHKQQLESAADIRDQMHELEQQNQKYLSKMLDMESDVDTIPLLKKQLDEQNGQLVDLKTGTTELEMQLQRKEQQVKDAEKRRKKLEAKANEDVKRAERAEQQVAGLMRQLENVGSGASTSLADASLSGPHAREQMVRLQRQNKQLQAALDKGAAGGSDGKAAMLRQQLEDAQQQRTQMEARLSKLLQENIVCRRERDQALATGTSSNGSSRSSASSTAQSERMAELAATIQRQQQAIGEIEHFRDMVPALKDKLKSKQRELEKKGLEQAKLENYVKQALNHANKTVKQSQMKYKNSLRILKNQIEQKQKEITYFSNMLEKSKTTHKREERLLMSAVYKIGLDLNSRLLRKDAAGSKSDVSTRPRSWLGQRRAEQRAQ